MRRPVLLVGLLVVLISMLFVGNAALAKPATGNNSISAQKCQKGGYALLAKSTSPDVKFTSETACTSFAAGGGTIVPFVPSTATPTITNTPVPPTDTPVPPTDTPVPTATPGPCLGLTQGYWKFNTDHWPASHPTTQTLQAVFDVPDQMLLDDTTLLEVLNLAITGRPEVALLREAVAALLNAATPGMSYALTEEQVIDQVNTALAGGATAMQTLTVTLDGYNNAGCPTFPFV